MTRRMPQGELLLNIPNELRATQVDASFSANM